MFYLITVSTRTYRGGNPIYVTASDPPPGDVLEQDCTTSPGGSCDFNVLKQEDVQLEARLVRGNVQTKRVFIK